MAQVLLIRTQLHGTIKDYAARYATQSRGSLHVHVIVWNISDEDAAMACEHIVSCIPDTVMHEACDCQNLHGNDYLRHRLATITHYKNNTPAVTATAPLVIV
jgi:hypothetical protein